MEAEARQDGRGRVLSSALLLLAVSVGASLFAHLFREASSLALRTLSGTGDPTRAADHRVAATFVAVASATVAAAVIGHRTTSRHRDRLGLTALAATARTGAAPPTVPATAARAAGTWLASCSLVSIGRESAILEAGGTLGSRLPARSPVHRGALTAAGLGAAFTAAYHAPIAAVLYVQEHLGSRRGATAATYTVVAVAVSHVTLTKGLGAEPLFPPRTGGYGPLLLLGAIALLPATAGSLLFLHARDRVAVAARDRLPRASAIVLLALATALTVSVVPLTAGNGMEALRFASSHPTVAVALALGLAKLVATTGALASGVPGGAFSPTMATAGGWALGAFIGLDLLGLPLPVERWDGVLLAMVIGISVGLGSPLTATFAVPEMTGDLSLVPAAAAVALGSTLLARCWTRRRGAPGPATTDELHDEDA